jgi:hypothetical protein
VTAGAGGQSPAGASPGFVSGEYESTSFDGVLPSRPADVPAAAQLADAGLAASAPRPEAAVAGRIFDPATTRRRSVVFEEDDELDIPDFLK